MKCNCHWIFCFAVMAAVTAAIIFTVPAVVVGRENKLFADTLWRVTCVVVACETSSRSVYDKVTFETRELFNQSTWITERNGCLLYPINSTVPCWVNENYVTVKRPGSSIPLVCTILAVVCGTAAVAIVALWISCAAREACRRRSRSKLKVIPVPEDIYPSVNEQPYHTMDADE